MKDPGLTIIINKKVNSIINVAEGADEKKKLKKSYRDERARIDGRMGEKYHLTVAQHLGLTYIAKDKTC